MAKSLTELAAGIVEAQAGHTTMAPEEMGEMLRKVFEALRVIKTKEEGPGVPEEERAPALDPGRSIQRNKVICLECGKEFMQLTNRHLREHGLNSREYRRKYGFSVRQPLTAKTLTAKRRKTAKELGLGERLQKAREAKRPKKRPPRRKRIESGPAEGE